ncbi:hypothetical protein [Nocardia cyriacigeorgica]|nr:hypothetical protein [Nocardia cyriacigeorgica]
MPRRNPGPPPGDGGGGPGGGGGGGAPEQPVALAYDRSTRLETTAHQR